MPVIPQYTESGSLDGGSMPGVSLNPAAFNAEASVDQAVQGVGQQVSQVAQHYQDLQQKQADFNVGIANTKLTAATTGAISDMRQKINADGTYTVGDQQVPFTQAATDQIQKVRNDYAAQMPDGQAKQEALARYDANMAYYKQQAAGIELAQRKANGVKLANDNADLLQHQVAANPARETLDSSIASSNKVIDDSPWLTAQEKVTLKENIASKLAMTQFQLTHPDGQSASRAAGVPDPNAKMMPVPGWQGRLIQQESSGDPSKQNDLGYSGLYQFGAPRLQTLGMYTPGAGENMKTWSKTDMEDDPSKWTGTFNIPGHPEIKTINDFLKSPTAQNAAFDAHTADISKEIDSRGLGKYVGQTIGDQTITREGIISMAHLGGIAGAQAALEGRGNAKDANNSSVLSYNRFGAGGSTVTPVRMSSGAGDSYYTDKISYDDLQKAVTTISHQARSQDTQINSDIAGMQKQVQDGYKVPDASWDAVGQRALQSSDPAVQQGYQTATAIRNTINSFAGQSPAQIEAQVVNMEGGLSKGATQPQVELAQAARSYANKLKQDVANNPIERATRDGVVQGVEPLSPQGDTAALTVALQRRAAQAGQAATFYGQPTAPMLMPAEKQAFKDIAAKGGTQMQNVATAAVTALGDKAGDFFNEVGDGGAFAHIGRLQILGGDHQAITDLAKYQQLAADPETKKQIPALPEKSVQENARTVYGTAFQAMPQFGANATDASRKLAQMNGMRNAIDPNTEAPALIKASQLAAGATFAGPDNTIQYGGVGTFKAGWHGWFGTDQKIPLPPGLRADKVGDVLNTTAIKDSDLAAMPNPPVAGDLKTPIPVSQILGGKMVAVSQGKYAVALGDPNSADAKWVMAPNGQRFTLDLNALEPTLRDRVPNAWRPQ